MKGPGEGQCCCPLLVLLYCTQRSHSLLQMVISTLQGCFEGDQSHFTFGKTKAQREVKSEQDGKGKSWPSIPRIYCHPGSRVLSPQGTPEHLP